MALTDREITLFIARLDKLEENQQEIRDRLTAIEASQRTLKWVIGTVGTAIIIAVEVAAYFIARGG